MGNKHGKVKEKKKLIKAEKITTPDPSPRIPSPPSSLLPEEALKQLEDAFKNGIYSGHLGFTEM